MGRVTPQSILSTYEKTGRGHRALWLLVHLNRTDDACLIWPFSRKRNGYAQITVDYENCLVHRVVCELVHGAPPFPEAQARHTCGKGKQGCVHPKHLVWGTAAENQADRRAHGTAMFAESHPNAVLTASDVIAIRNRHLGGESNTELAKAFGVHRRTIARVANGTGWRDV